MTLTSICLVLKEKEREFQCAQLKIDGYSVGVKETGEIKALSEN